MNLFQRGTFTLHSGQQSDFIIDCRAFSDEDWQTLAWMAAKLYLPPFGSVEGVPTGGLKFAAALQQYCTKGPLLVADDVCTTGNSMNEHLGNRQARGCVVFCRDVCPPWVIPLFRMPESYRDQMTAIPFTGGEHNQWLNKDLVDLPRDIWLRAIKKLDTIGVRTVGDLINKEADELYSIPGFGMGCLNNVREALKEIGLFLKNDEAPRPS